jgi:hypothetical protein
MCPTPSNEKLRSCTLNTLLAAPEVVGSKLHYHNETAGGFYPAFSPGAIEIVLAQRARNPELKEKKEKKKRHCWHRG